MTNDDDNVLNQEDTEGGTILTLLKSLEKTTNFLNEIQNSSAIKMTESIQADRALFQKLKKDLDSIAYGTYEDTLYNLKLLDMSISDRLRGDARRSGGIAPPGEETMTTGGELDQDFLINLVVELLHELREIKANILSNASSLKTKKKTTKKQGRVGRPHFSEDVWVWSQIHEHGGDPKEIFSEWFEKPSVKARKLDLDNAKRQFNKIKKKDWYKKG